MCEKPCFLKCNSSVFIGDRREKDGPVKARWSFITKGPSAYLRDRRDKMLPFCPNVGKTYLVQAELIWGGGKLAVIKFEFEFIFLIKHFFKNTKILL